MKKSLRRALVVTLVVVPLAAHAALSQSATSNDSKPFHLHLTASPAAEKFAANKFAANKFTADKFADDASYAHRRINLHPTLIRQIAQARAEAQPALYASSMHPSEPLDGI